jgi:hypothetical protein
MSKARQKVGYLFVMSAPMCLAVQLPSWWTVGYIALMSIGLGLWLGTPGEHS